MNKNNPLERHLLSRCYSSEAKILEVLTSRYSINNQKPYIVLTPTTATPANSTPKALLHRDISSKDENSGSSPENSSNSSSSDARIKKNTRLELKRYIKDTLSKQAKLAKKIQRHRALQKKVSFPIERMLQHYEIPVFDEFVGLCNLWQQYMRNLLFPPRNQQQDHTQKDKSNQNTNTNQKQSQFPTLTTLLPKLSSADYTGCLLTVLKSKNTQLVGTRGIVVWDTQYLFIVCVPRNEDSKEWTENLTKTEDFSPSQQVGGLKVISKNGSIFSFDVIIDEDTDDCIGFNIVGSRFEFRNVDRSSKKFKNHGVDDLL